MKVSIEYPQLPDYEALFSLLSRAEPQRTRDGKTERATDRRRVAAGCASRWVVARQATGELVGAAWIGHEVFRFKAEHPRFWLAVEPSATGSGVGSALWSAILHLGRGLGAKSFKTSTTVPDAATSHFAQRHGFVRLPGFVGLRRALDDLDHTELSRNLALEESGFASRGLSITTLRAASEEPDFWSRYAKFNREIAPDLPGPVPCVAPNTADLRAEFLDNPRAMMDRSFIALVPGSGAIAGVSTLYAGSRKDEVSVGLTAIDSSWRRLGLARYLKQRVMLEAQHAGATAVTTMCFESNLRILELNKDLGFAHDYGQSIWCHTPETKTRP